MMRRRLAIVGAILVGVGLGAFLRSAQADEIRAGIFALFADAPLSGIGTSGSHLTIPAATSSVNGYLTSTDWSTFNAKQPAAAYTSLYAMAGPTATQSTTAFAIGGGQFSSTGYTTVTFRVTGFVDNASGTLTATLYNVTDSSTASTITITSTTDTTTASGSLSLPSSAKQYEVRLSVSATYTATVLWAGLTLI